MAKKMKFLEQENQKVAIRQDEIEGRQGKMESLINKDDIIGKASPFQVHAIILLSQNKIGSKIISYFVYCRDQKSIQKRTTCTRTLHV